MVRDDDDESLGIRPTRLDTDRPEATETQSMTPIELAKFKCIRNAAYHEDWERFYERWHKVLMAVVVIVGTFSIGSSLTSENYLATIGTAVAVLAGLIDILWDVDGLARLHSDLRRRSYDLLARLEAGEPVQRIEVEFIRIVAEEPPPMHAANALAFNAAVDALGRPPEQKYVLKPWQRRIRHWYPFRPNEFPTIENIKR